MFTYENILDLVVRWAEDALPQQVLDPARDDDGAFIAGGWCLWEVRGIPAPDVSNHAHAIACLAYAYLAVGSRYFGDAAMLDRTLRAIRFLRSAQRPTGLIDLPSTNFESPPDTAFAVQLLAPVVEMARRVGTPESLRIAGDLGEFIRTGAAGIVGRGFHTANHRWVISAALAQATSLFPGLAPVAMPYFSRIMAEGIDLNEDGEYTERSTVVYNAVCDRSLRFMADYLNRPDLLAFVRKNLDSMLRLLHADGTAVTSTSVREDRGRRIRPLSLADSFYDMARRDKNGVWAHAADMLVGGDFAAEARAWPFDPVPGWLFGVYALHPEYRQDALARKPLPDEYSVFLPAAGLWRVRRGDLSATAASGHTTAFAVRYGDVSLKAVKLFGSYIVSAIFSADEMAPDGQGEAVRGVSMRHRGDHRKLPGYDLPLNRPVPYGSFHDVAAERARWTQPPMDIVLDVHEVPGGFDLHARTEGGLDRIMFQIEFCFDGPGEWETDDALVAAENGQVVFLKAGYGVFHRGRHGLRIGPGAISHRVPQMRNTEPEPDSFRVLMTFVTPVDHAFDIRYGAWSMATGGLLASFER